MGGASSFLAMLSIAGFLGCAWFASKASRLAGVSSIVLEITTGVVLGPSVLGLVSPEYAECQHARHVDCVAPKDLADRVRQGLPLGEGLGMIANMDYCPREQYAHDEQHHVDHSELGHNETGHNETTDHNATGHDETGHDETAAAAMGSDEMGAASNGSAFARDGEAVAAAGLEGRQIDGGGGGGGGVDGHRRLSGGGGTYSSYEECLVKSCEAEVAHHCSLTPDFFTLIGHAGVALMIFESGMHFDFEKAGKVGPKACCVAVLGTILPLITGAALTVIYGRPLMPDGVSVGTALAPTSVGIALRLLGEAKVLQEDFGQAIITAAFVDDILSLVLFNVLFSLRGEFNVMSTVVYPIVGVAFMGIAMLLAVKFWPYFINQVVMPRVPEKEGAKVSPKDEVLFLIMMILLVLYATTTHFLGTHLWGCFIAGMSFACLDSDHHAHHVWVKQTKRATSWMIRIFFSATVAFSIPVSKLLSVEAFLKGSLMGIGPCILTKVCCAPFMGPAKWVIGWAMVGRAEFAYLIAQMAAAGNMMDSDTFSIVIWALLYATIFAPFIFRKVLDRYVKTYCADVLAAASGEGKDDSGDIVRLEDIDLKGAAA